MEQVFLRARAKAELARLRKLEQRASGALWMAQQEKIHAEYMAFIQRQLAGGSAKSVDSGDWWQPEGSKLMLRRES